MAYDITESKQAQDTLLAREQELEDKTHELEEMNAALRVLLKKREDDRIELAEKIQLNAKQLIEPYLDNLKQTRLTPRQASLLDMIVTNLDEIISPFARGLTSAKHKLTPQEIKIASLIRQGKTTKNIAELMSLSSRTIEFHRRKIRHKLGLKHKSDRLQSYLMSLK
jgi:DNA-binding CsgD family transcriptional regulator